MHIICSHQHVLHRSSVRRLIVAVICLSVIGAMGLIFFDDDLADICNLLVMALPTLFLFIEDWVAVVWRTAVDACCRDTQTSLLISRSPPRYGAI